MTSTITSGGRDLPALQRLDGLVYVVSGGDHSAYVLTEIMVTLAALWLFPLLFATGLTYCLDAIVLKEVLPLVLAGMVIAQASAARGLLRVGWMP